MSEINCLIDHDNTPCNCKIRAIEKGRDWNHHNGQLESDIFDRDLEIKRLRAENEALKETGSTILQLFARYANRTKMSHDPDLVKALGIWNVATKRDQG